MFASEKKTNILNISNVFEKLDVVKNQVDLILNDPLMKHNISCCIPLEPSREIHVLDPKHHPPKKGLSFKEGRARMLHDLASIELQALELGFRGLIEYPNAPEEFRVALALLTKSEADHLRLCLDGIEDLGFQWGNWPVHTALWKAVRPTDSLLDRILIVHRYLEGSGLDAGSYLIKRLEGMGDSRELKIVRQINKEEIDHVSFGSHWYHKLCQKEGLDFESDFKKRMFKLRSQLPKRVEHINKELRNLSGFTHSEIQTCYEMRESFLIPLK